MQRNAAKAKAVEGREARGRGVVKALSFTQLPFVLAETIRGTASLLTGWLPMPPVVGAGTAIDLAIPLAGIDLAVLLIVRTEQSGAGETRTSQKR